MSISPSLMNKFNRSFLLGFKGLKQIEHKVSKLFPTYLPVSIVIYNHDELGNILLFEWEVTYLSRYHLHKSFNLFRR